MFLIFWLTLGTHRDLSQGLALAGFSLRIEVAGGYKITGESGHSEKNLTSSFHRLMKFYRVVAGGFSDA